MEKKADDGPRPMDDVWIQALVLSALISGLFGRSLIAGELRRLWAMSRRPAPARPAVPLPRTVLEPPPRKKTPRIPGRWVVDPRMPPGTDFGALGPALASAEEGDAILLKPGVYQEGVVVSKAVTISGAGESPDDVWLTHSGPRTVLVEKTRAVFENLTLASKAGHSDWVIQIAGGALVLRNVNLRSAGQGIRVQDADADVVDCVLEGRRAMSISGRSRVRLLRADVAAEESALRAEGSSAELVIERTKVRSTDGFAIEAQRFAKVRMSDVTLSRCGRDAVALKSGAEARITDSMISDNRGCGVSVDGGLVQLGKVQLARNRCGVGFLGPGTLEANGCSFTELSLGPIAIKPGMEKNVTLRGAGNTGWAPPRRKGGGGG